MPKLLKSDLRYEYSWKATEGDNPHLIHEDAKHLSRKEGYEMLTFLNNLGLSSDKMKVEYGEGSDLSKENRLYVEWMLKEHFKSTSPGRGKVTEWLNANWRELKKSFTSLKPELKTTKA